MLAKESGSSNFGLPEEVLEVLPSDPFEQLDVARKITSVALSTRVSALESESSALRVQLAEKDHLIAELQAQVESLEASLSETADQLSRADEEKVRPDPNPIYIFLGQVHSYFLFGVGELGKRERFAVEHCEEAEPRCLQGTTLMLCINGYILWIVGF